MSDSITFRAVRRVTPAAVVVAALCLPGRAAPIGEPTGACCIPFGICEVTTIQECFGELGGVIWAPELDCDSFTCPPLGACCRPDDTCQITGQGICENSFDGTYQGDGVECRDISCAHCPADFDGDDIVGIQDLLILIAQWGPCPPECFADIDGDGEVGIADLLELLASWGPCR